MILARCPACSTTFRVRPEQLSARQGRVRCGQCNHAFNALESVVEEEHPLADEAPAPDLPSQPEAEAPFFILEEKLPDDELPLPGEMPDGADDTWPPEADVPADDERIEPTGEIGAEAPQEWPPMETDAEDVPALSMDFPLPDDEALSAMEAPPVDAAAPPDTTFHLPEPHGETPVDFDALIHTRDVAPAFLTPAPRPSHRADGQAPIVEEEQEEEAGDAHTASEEAASPALGQAAWAAAATLLILALLAQGVLVFRDDIAQSSPQMRPFMESLCAGLGCDLPLPRDPASIAIESSDIQPDAGREAFFTLHATLRNRAEFQQAWPHLEITLTDARDKALVRRVLEPGQWLPADAPRDAFPARREVVTRVGFEAPGVAAAGYRVYAFYP
jgi:predicted Zn finger-like uncharacterized protein